MDRQQNLGRQNYEDSLDEFQQFKEQYTTYLMQPEVTPNTIKSLKTPKKVPFPPKSEKPKLKMIQEPSENSTEADFLANNKKIRKAIANNSQVINVGGAIFKSNFESGNIYSVTKTAPNTFEISLNKQTNSDRISAWFYFSCEGLKGQNKFVIKGFTKSSSLYNQGMRICYRQAGENNVWRRGGSKICYTDTYTEQQEAKTTYELRFIFFFKQTTPNSVQFAYCFPYTYTNLINFLSLSKPHLTFQSLGKSYQGRSIPLVTIGNQNSKQVIVISARAHPGQTVGSWMMEGFLKELISESQYSKNLREAFLFKIIPMINVDGVTQGNYRFSGSGFDLNRKWKKCKEKYHPEVYHLKKFIKNLHKEKEVLMYIDLHGHSRQKHVFFYGCCPQGHTDSEGNPNNKPKQFPYLMSKLHSSFRYDYCSYAVQKQKEGTARITMWNELKIDYVYTLEASFCGNEGGQNYQIADYEKIGSKLCVGICLYFSSLIEKNLKEANPDVVIPASSSKMTEELKKNMNEFYENPSLAEIQFEGNSSDSEPEAGQIPQQARKNISNSVLSMQKYYKASKMLKLSQKNYTHDEKALKDKFKKNQLEQKQNKPTHNATYSINLSKMKDNQSKKPNSKMQKRRQIKTSTAKSTHNSYSVRAQVLNKTINEKLDQLHRTKNRTEQNNYSTSFLGKKQADKYQSEELFPGERAQIINNKKKAISFQGAQYRRVRKLAEEHNRRHFSVEQTTYLHEEDELIKGLIGMNNLLQIDQIKSSPNPSHFFPTSVGNKNRRQSIQMHFRKQIKAQDYSTRRFPANGYEHDVKCFGKQII